MKKVLLLLSFVFASLISFSQGIQTGGIFVRVVDSAAYVTSVYVTTSHTKGYGDIWYSVSSQLFWKWNGSAYELLSSGGEGDFWPLTGSATLNGNTTIDGDGNSLTLTNILGYTFESTNNIHFQAGNNIHWEVANDLDIDVGGDVKINGVSGNSTEFIGNIDGHLVWAVPAGSGGGGGVGVDNVLDINTTQAGTVTTGEDELYSFVVDKDSIDDDDDVLHARFSGTLAGNGNNKIIKVYWGDDPMVNVSGTFTSTWTINCEIIRVSSTAQQSNCAIVGASSGLTHSSVVIDLDQNLSSDVEISLTGEGTATNDIVFETATIFRNTGGGGGGGGGGDLSLADLVTSETPNGTVDGVNDDFTVDFTPAGFFHWYMNGLLQDEGGDYTRTGPNITMIVPPLTGSILSASYIK